MSKYVVNHESLDIEHKHPTNAINVLIATVYVDRVRPLETGGTIVEDFEWRRSDQANCVPLDEIEDVVREKLKELGRDFSDKKLKVRFDRHAGCSMCPCSPGYVVTCQEASRDDSPYDLWIARE